MINITENPGYDKVERHSCIDVVDSYYINAPCGWIAKLRFLDLCELIYVTKGSLSITVNKKSVILSAGDAYLIRRYSTLSGNMQSTDACCFYTVSFISTVLKYDTLFSKVLSLERFSPNAEMLLSNINLYNSRESDARYLCDSSMLLLLETLFTSQRKEPERVQMNGIMEYVNDNISSDLTIEKVGKHFHYSGDYISKIFKEQFGMPLKQYIVERKLSVAKRLLATSELPIQNIASSIGFEDTVLFEKFFKYHTKTTPKKYRNLYT